MVIFYFCKETRASASFNYTLYLKIQTIIQSFVSSVASQSLSLYFSRPFFHNFVPNYCLLFLPSTSQSITSLFPPSYLLIVLPPCSSPLPSNTAADLLHLNSAAYLSIQVPQSCMIPVTWQPLWESSVSTEDRWPCKSWLTGWVKAQMEAWGGRMRNPDSTKIKEDQRGQNSNNVWGTGTSEMSVPTERLFSTFT